MTKEELEKEAEKALDKRMGTYAYINRMNVQIPYTDGYKDSAEPREKQIQIDAKQIRALQKQNGELTDKAKELEEQVKKMKCCRICAYYEDLGISDWSPCKTCEDNSNWEFAD